MFCHLKTGSFGAALLIALSAATPASSQQLGGLHWLAGEIRGQIASVEAQAEATLRRCDEYDDVRDELEELCHKMSRLEHALARPIHCQADLRRLARHAERVDDQVCELQEEIEDALNDLHHDHARHHASRIVLNQPVGYGGHVYRRGGVQIAIGGLYGPRFTFASQPRMGLPYTVGYPNVFAPAPRVLRGGIRPDGEALRCEARELRELTSQLTRILCR